MSEKSVDLKWAHEVIEVYNALGSIPSSRQFSSPSARYMFEHVANGDDSAKFVSTLVPKAVELLKKYTAPELDEAYVEVDRRTIQELQRFLREAIEDSKETTPSVDVCPEDIDELLGISSNLDLPVATMDEFFS